MWAQSSPCGECLHTLHRVVEVVARNEFGKVLQLFIKKIRNIVTQYECIVTILCNLIQGRAGHPPP